MRSYQLVLVLKPSLKETDRKKVVDTVKSLLKDIKIEKEEDWGEKPLAYPIKHSQLAYYVNMLFEVKDVLPQDLEKRIQTNDDILRHLLLRRE